MHRTRHALAFIRRLDGINSLTTHSRGYAVGTEHDTQQLAIAGSPPPSIHPTPPPEKKKRGRKPKAPTPLEEITHGSSHHHDLASFLSHASRTSLSTASNVYVGTHYEYTVASSLARLNFSLTRVGRTSDRGIDLLGHWAIPNRSLPLRILIQCKAEGPRPSMIRELEGAVVGAPSAWRAEGVVAILAAAKEATKGVRDALTRSRIPMGFLNIGTEGLVRQFVWNQAAVEGGLEGVGVTLRYSVDREQEIALTWNGLPWPKT